MKFKALLLVHSIIYLVFAALLFFIPKILWPMYGLEVNDRYANFLSQHNSIFLGGLAVMSWLMRDIPSDGVAAKKFTQGLLWTNLLGVIITLYACITGVFFGFGWSDPAFFALLSGLCFSTLRKTI